MAMKISFGVWVGLVRNCDFNITFEKVKRIRPKNINKENRLL